MYTLLLFSLFLFFQSPTAAQPDSIAELGNKQIAQHTTYFNIKDGKFRGADSLQKALGSAHFIALGELHNRTRLGEFTTALLLHLHPVGFRKLVVETGPYSAEKLERLIGSGKDAVIKFYDRYSSKLFGIYPIPFFTGKADLEFLAAADSLDYDLWGMDQEFGYSFKYLMDELANFSGKSLTQEQQELHSDLSSTFFWWNRRSKIFSGFDLYCRLLNNNQLQTYLESFDDSGNPDISLIANAVRKSLEIYCKGDSRKRIYYFKENFDRYYRTAFEENPDTKIIIKIGSYHAGRQKSPLGLYDIGNHIHRLADSTGRKSVHLRYLNRFHKGRDMLGKEGWKKSTHFMSVGSREEWALVDLRPLRQMISKDFLQGSDYEEREIRNYDFIIIPPEDKMVEKHY